MALKWDTSRFCLPPLSRGPPAVSLRLDALHICCHIRHCPSTEDTSIWGQSVTRSVWFLAWQCNIIRFYCAARRLRIVFSKTLFYGIPSIFVHVETAFCLILTLWSDELLPPSLDDCLFLNLPGTPGVRIGHSNSTVRVINLKLCKWWNAPRTVTACHQLDWAGWTFPLRSRDVILKCLNGLHLSNLDNIEDLC